MNLAKIHDEVEQTLGNNPKKVAQRREAISKLRKSLAKVKNRLLPMLRRRKAWFSTTQTGTGKANGCARVQLLGIDVGELILEGTSYWFYPKWIMLEQNSGFPEIPWQWSNHSKHAAAIRLFLKKSEEHLHEKNINEREIQWQLANALRSNKKGDTLRHLRPVTWNGRFTEIGVSVTESDKPDTDTTGTIDLLVRRRIGGQRGFLVFELKKPGVTDVAKTLHQVLRYATALNIEANAGDAKNRKNYHCVFGSKGEGELKIGAVVVLQDNGKVRDVAPGILQQYWDDRGNSKIDRIGVLLYKLDELETTVIAWEWLPGWDASKLAPSPQQRL